MKLLYLVRHAKAIPGDVGVTDFKRALAESGQTDAEAMGQRLREKGVCVELFVSSPADRALETAHIFAEQLDYSISHIVLRDEIYEDDTDALEGIVTGLSDDYSSIMLFGHNPTLSELAHQFLPDFDSDLRTSGVAGVAFQTDHWHTISSASARLVLLDFPVRVSSKAYKKARKNIQGKISATLEDILEHFDGQSSKQLEKVIQKTSKKLAKELVKVLQLTKVEELSGVRKDERVDRLASLESDELAPADDSTTTEPHEPKAE